MALDVTGKWRYPPPNPEWLSRHDEPVVAPEMPVIDAHHHIWQENGVPYLLDDLLADLGSGHDVAATVFVQAHYGYEPNGPLHLRPVGETRRIAALRSQARRRGVGTDVAAAIVGYADLTLGAGVAEVIEAHIDAAPDAFRGVRHSVSRDENFPDGIVIRPAPAGLLADPAYREGLATLTRYGLSYDAMLYHRQIGELTEAARALPDLKMILDHYGCPLGVGPYEDRRVETFQAWRLDMRELARCPNVVVKLGGLGMIVCGARWHERPRPPSSDELLNDWFAYVETCVELFGPARCMFESNFPVDKAMYSYAVAWNAFKKLALRFGDDNARELLGGTAARTYGLKTEQRITGFPTIRKRAARAPSTPSGSPSPVRGQGRIACRKDPPPCFFMGEGDPEGVEGASEQRHSVVRGLFRWPIRARLLSHRARADTIPRGGANA